MYKSILCTAALLLLSLPAHATTSRIHGLSGNAGFIDESDFFQYPSALESQPGRAMLNYNGSFDGGLFFGDGQALWFQRHNAVDGVPPGPVLAEAGFRALYAKASGESGFLLRAAQDAGTFTFGGAWSNGPGKGEPKNLAIDGDLRLIGKLTDESEFGLNAAVTGRNLTQQKLTYWKAGLDYDGASGDIQLFGGYTLGPRYRNDDVRVALQLGPMGTITVQEDVQLLSFYVPFTNLAAEYTLREWFVIRGAMYAVWVGDTNSEDVVNNLAWSVVPGGTMGVGFSHKSAQFDMSVNPGWALAGPAVLSGSTNPMFAMLSARFDL